MPRLDKAKAAEQNNGWQMGMKERTKEEIK
jgi:hypothetical protein